MKQQQNAFQHVPIGHLHVKIPRFSIIVPNNHLHQTRSAIGKLSIIFAC